MNHRQRVLATLNHRQPDRVPIDLGSTRNTGILIEPYQALTRYLGLTAPDSQDKRFGLKVLGLATPDKAVLERLDIDFRGLYLGKPDRSLEKLLPDGSHQDDLPPVNRKRHHSGLHQKPFANSSRLHPPHSPK